MIIRVHYFSEVCEDFVSKDISIDTSMCETRDEELHYVLNKCLNLVEKHLKRISTALK